MEMPPESRCADGRADLRARYGLAVLLLAYVLAFMDRQVIGLLVEPIKLDLALSDTDFSLVSGFSFALCFAVVGLLAGRAADRFDRRNLILLGMLIWVPATALAGFAASFSVLLLSRVLIAVGEAVLGPAAYSMIGDYFPRRRLSLAMGVYSLGVNLGSAMAFLVGGAVMASVSVEGAVLIGTFGPFQAWQLAFLAVAAPGILVFGLMLMVREPPRREVGAAPVPLDAVAPARLADFLRTRVRVHAPLILGFAVIAIVTYSHVVWLPAAFIRAWGWTSSQIGSAYGLVILTCGVAGMLISGALADWLVDRGHQRGALSVSIAASFGLIGSNTALAFAPSADVALVAAAITTFLLGMPIALAPSIILTVTPNRFRGQLVSITSLAITLVGLGLGPTLVAVCTEQVLNDPRATNVALGAVSAAAAFFGCILLQLAYHPYQAMFPGTELRLPLHRLGASN